MRGVFSPNTTGRKPLRIGAIPLVVVRGVCTGERDAATYIAHKLHVPVTQIRHAIETGEQLEELPATAAMAR